MRDLSGQTFGSYRLESVVGRGGMGEVYRARHLRLTNRLAAVKVLPASLAIEPDFLQRFEHEANSAASLDHPAILPVWDYGEHEGQPYLAMPYVPGGSLKEYLEERGSLDPAEVLGLIAPIAEALDHAHGKGIIHRDVKPANILLREDGRPLLADFGIAKAVEAGQAGLTRAGSTIGTPEYMAPEQIEGKAEPRSDLYSLGVVIFQMITGQVPYEGGTPYEIAYKQMHTPLPPVRWFRQDLAPALERVLSTALAKDPAQRYPTGRALVAAFREALAGVHGAATVANPIGSQATHRLETVGATTPLGTQPPPPRGTAPPSPIGPVGPVVVPPGQPRDERRARGVPVGMIVALVALSIVAATLLGVYVNFLMNPGATPTPTVNAAATQGARGTATARANQVAAATETAAANAGAAAQATLAAERTATAEQQAQQAGTATANANAQNAGTATANANIAATAAVAATANANVAATANAAGSATVRANTAATATTIANATAAANAGAAQTATAAARPTATAVPPTATAAPPTQTPRPPTQTPVPPTQPPAANWGPALPPLNGGKGYEDDEGRFSFSVPNNWAERDSGNSQVSFGAPNGQATMAVDLSQASSATDIEDLNAGFEEEVAKQSGYAAVSLDKVTVNGQSAYRRVYRITSQGQQVQVQQVYFLNNNRAHVLTFACRVADFEQFAPTFNGIAGSYKVGGR